jgi:hypothetical protein
MPHGPLVNTSPRDPITVFSQAGATITTSGDSGALDFTAISSGFASVYVGAVSGTGATITFYVDVQDANQHWLNVAQVGSALNAGPNFAFGNFGPSSGAGYVLTGIGRLRWTVAGTTPSFTGVDLSVIGR